MPDWRAEVRQRLAGLAVEATRAEEIVEELAQHLEDRYRELTLGGTTEGEAARLALSELEASRALRDELQQVERPAPAAPVLGGPAGAGFWAGLGSDVRYGFRALRKSRGVTAVALLTLALGIGGTTAVFSLVDAVLLRPLPFSEPNRLVSFWGSAPEMGLPVFSYPDAFYAYFRARSRTLDPIVAYAKFSGTLTGSGEPERIKATGVTIDFFSLFGSVPILGRTFLPEEGQRDANAVVLLSHGIWQRRFGSDPAIVGKPIVLDGKPATVVGVMPRGFEYPTESGPTELWVPAPIDPQSLNCWCWSTLGRLAPGRSPDDAVRELVGLTDDFWRERNGEPAPGLKRKRIVNVVPFARTLVGEVQTPLLVLFGAVGLVLLIACANVANLLLGRVTARSRELAVRSCLGASRYRIVRQLLVESLLLAAGGALLGLGLAFFGVRAVSPLVLARMTHLHEVAIHPKAVFFSMAVTLGTVLLFGLAPALRAARTDLHEAVKDGSRTSGSRQSRWLHHAFVVSQFALSLMLLIGAGLLIRSFRNLMEVDLGFQPRGVLVASVALQSGADKEAAKVRQFFAALAERVRALPGVESVGLTLLAPFSGGSSGQIFTIWGREPASGQPNLVAEVRLASPDYFRTVGTPVLRGRAIDATDTDQSPQVAVVDDTLARRFWPDGNAVGRQIRLGDASSKQPWLQIVGVVAPVKYASVNEEPVRFIYLPLAQQSTSSMDLVVRTAGDPAVLSGAIRREVRALDPTIPFHEVHTLESAVARTLDTRRLTNRLLLGFALAALLLAAIGIYGVMAQSVGQRFNEFGIRLALGAAPGEVLRLVLGQGLRLVLLGIALGLAGALAAARLLASLLFQVRPFDPLTFGAVAAFLLVVALAACYLPARRATATDPLQALRYE